ncbi:hypothetical protein L6164_002948 [Bauhinia variegata]|uniref:Uncharacterized protein n=1 Tax=Bauhinia variegata TaxID=167791 RepID=A0ACB9PZY3_BAUVA|nr:hypothetical protein L6164_002948 [Bauhinia variegata]
MPSSSSPNPTSLSQTKWKHDVFISCMDCFQHARSGFRYHLLCLLQSAGLDVYKDVYGIRKELLQTYGFSYTPLLANGGLSLLLKIIEGCRVSIIIFSSDFASSRWCLEELEKIMECHTTIGQIVLPVFYNVEPWEVGRQRGTFGDAFQELLKRVSATKDKRKRWGRALTKAAELEGWPLTDSLR